MEQSFMSDKMDRIASQVEKEDGGAEVCTGDGDEKRKKVTRGGEKDLRGGKR